MSTTIATLRAKLDSLRLAGAPYAQRVAVSDQIRRMERIAPAAPRPAAGIARCCNRAVVRFNCTCSHVTTCPEHGVRHHGTHD